METAKVAGYWLFIIKCTWTESYFFPFNIPVVYSNHDISFLQRLEKSTFRILWVSRYPYWQSLLPGVYDRKGPTSYFLAVLQRRRAWLIATCSVETLSWTAWHTALSASPWADCQTYSWRSLWKSNNKNHQLWPSAMGSSSIPFPHFHFLPFSTACQKGKNKDTTVSWLWQTHFKPSSILHESLLGHDSPQSTGFKLQIKMKSWEKLIN